MRATDTGIILTKQEAACLVGFAHPDKRRPQVNGAQFIVDSNHVRAYASDGHRAVEAVCEHVPDAEEPRKGEWFVSRELLDSARKLVENKQTMQICFESGHYGRIVILDEDKEVRVVEIADAISSQTLLPLDDVQRVVKLPTTNKASRCMTIAPAKLESIVLVSKASEAAGVDLWIPKTRSDALIFQLVSPEGTWTGSLASCGYDQDGTANATNNALWDIGEFDGEDAA